jgi:hypothetical protein
LNRTVLLIVEEVTYFINVSCYFLCFNVQTQLVLLVGTKLQQVIATLALENAGIIGLFSEAKLRPRDELFWFKKPELLLSLIHFILFQVVHGSSKSCAIIYCLYLLLSS